MNALFKIVHLTVFNASVQALGVLWRICQIHTNHLDRFYRALYSKLFDERLFSSSKQMIFLTILYKALIADDCTKRLKAFIKRLAQVRHGNDGDSRIEDVLPFFLL
jgi:ribosome biogenesis protein MAK21